MKKTAILLDGGFVYKVLKRIHARSPNPDDIVRLCEDICTKGGEELFRIYYYDCPPFQGKKPHPLLKRDIEFSKSHAAARMSAFHESLAHKDHVAFRRGILLFKGWQFHERVANLLMQKGKVTLTDSNKTVSIQVELPLESLGKHRIIDLARLPKKPEEILRMALGRLVKPVLEQKRVDMKIGLDVAWLSSRRIVDRIAMVTADTDFVPVMKFVRREGVQVIIVPLGQRLSPELIEHADEVRRIDMG